MNRIIIGIDEAGRGPLAGPVTVGAFYAEERTGKWILKNVFSEKLRDSKKLSPKKREEIYKKLSDLKNKSKVNFIVAHSSPKMIDKIGITKAVRSGIASCLKNLTPSPSPRGRRGEKDYIQVRLDGLLKAPEQFRNQKTIVKGDEKDVFIACASIVAKVSRDRLMCRLAKKYPVYSLDIHKGYGTTKHLTLIKHNGLTEIHRKSFCKKLHKL